MARTRTRLLEIVALLVIVAAGAFVVWNRAMLLERETQLAEALAAGSAAVTGTPAAQASQPTATAPPPARTPIVLDGHTADWVIVAARTQEGIGSFLIESPAVEPVPTMDPTRKAARLVLDETRATPIGPLGDHHAIWRRVARFSCRPATACGWFATPNPSARARNYGRSWPRATCGIRPAPAAR